MAVENETSPEKNDNNENSVKGYESGFGENISLDSVQIEPEFDKQNSLVNKLETVKGKQDVDENETVEIQIDDGEEVPDANITQKQSNTYAAKKTVAQGMMDIALITANANQLRYIIEFNRNSSTYYLNLVLIIISLFLQVGVGMCLIFKGRLDLRGESKHKNAKKINNYVVVGIFLVTVINVFIASFTITGNK